MAGNEACGMNSQSPIDIPNPSAVRDPTLGAIQFEDYDMSADLAVSNNGHSGES